MADAVLDSSAILAVVNAEPGASLVLQNLPGARISAVNMAEVVTKLVVRGLGAREARELLAPLELVVEGYGLDRACATAELCRERPARALSLGDRACLALARELGLPAITGDRAWAEHDFGVTIVLFR